MRIAAGAVLACASFAVWVAGLGAQSAGPTFSGQWQINKELSTAPGPGSPDRRRSGERPGGAGPGGGPGRGFGGGFGRRGGRGNGPEGPNPKDIERRRALLDEAAQFPTRFTLVQRDDAITIIEPDGVVRTYVANGKTEKHQLTAGVIETRSRWKNGAWEMQLTVDRITMVRTFMLREGASQQLHLTTEFKGGPGERQQVSVYDRTDLAQH